MTWTKIIARARALLTEPNPGFFTVEEMEAWAEDGQMNLCLFLPGDALWSILSRVDRSAPGGGPTTVTLPSDFMRPANISIVDPGGVVIPCEIVSLPRLRGARFNASDLATNQRPLVAIIQGGSLIKMDGFSGDITVSVRINYVRTPSGPSSTNEPEIPIEFHHLIPLYIAVQGRRKEHAYDAAEALRQQYQSEVAAVAATYGGTLAVTRGPEGGQ